MSTAQGKGISEVPSVLEAPCSLPHPKHCNGQRWLFLFVCFKFLLQLFYCLKKSDLHLCFWSRARPKQQLWGSSSQGKGFVGGCSPQAGRECRVWDSSELPRVLTGEQGKSSKTAKRLQEIQENILGLPRWIFLSPFHILSWTVPKSWKL